MLEIHLIEGESAVYAVSEIERIGFQIYYGVDELVVVHAGGIDPYPTEAIRRIEFLWDFSSVDNPEDAAVMIDAIRLFQNQPNPFSSETRIAFELPQDGETELQIFSPDGRLVRTLTTGERAAGPHTIPWDGRDDEDRALHGGVYFYSLRAPGVEECRQMILLP